MPSYIIRRMFLAVVAVIGVTIVVFIAARLSGDVVYLIAPQDATESEIAHIRTELGLDRPIWVQYARFAERLVTGDFGESIRYRRPAMDVILSRVPATVQLAVAAFVFSMTFGIILGVIAARSRGSWVDSAARLFAVLGQSMPNFWIGMMAILVFAVWLGWLPTSGREGWKYLVLPATTLGLFTMAAVMRITRSAMIEALDAEYVKFLRAKGVPEWQITWKHALRNSLVPVTALAGIQLGNLLGGAVIVETVFSWPGVGSVMIEAINNRDYPLIQAGVLLTSIFLISLNLIVDLLFGVIDPRIRYT
jgi:peptide/nickel transport system permease protein